PITFYHLPGVQYESSRNPRRAASAHRNHCRIQSAHEVADYYAISAIAIHTMKEEEELVRLVSDWAQDEERLHRPIEVRLIAQQSTLNGGVSHQLRKVIVTIKVYDILRWLCGHGSLS